MPIEEVKPVTLTRQQLYDEVWATPMVRLAKKYGVNIVGLAKACDEHDIPRPRQGYWQRKQYGWAEEKPPLPPAEDVAQDTVRLREPGAGMVDDAGHPRLAADDEVNRLLAAELAGPPIEVPTVLRNPHPLIAAAIESDQWWAARERLRKADLKGYVAAPDPVARAVANVSASKAHIARAYRVMDTLLKALESRGHRVIGVPERYKRVTRIMVLGEEFDLRIYEPDVQKPHVLTAEEQRVKAKYGDAMTTKRDRVPSGRLCLQLRTTGLFEVCVQFRDGPRSKVEDRVKHLIVGALHRVDVQRLAHAEHRREAAIQMAKERQRQAEAERLRRAEQERAREQQRVNELVREVAQWRTAREIREYLEAMRSTGRLRRLVPGRELAEWMAWAAIIADRIDPLHTADPLEDAGLVSPV